MRNRGRSGSRDRQLEALRRIQAADAPSVRQPDEPLSVHHIATGVDLLALDHVALTVADPDAMAAFLCDHVGMHELAREAGFVIVGAGGRAATLRLVAGEGPRTSGALGRVVLRVANVAGAAAKLPAQTAVEGDQIELASFRGPEGLSLGFTLVAGGGIDYDLDHVLLRVDDPEQTRMALAQAGFVPRGPALHVADKYLTIAGSPGATDRPLLDHVALRVQSVQAVAAQARERGIEIDEHVPADELGIVLPGPERIRLRFLERTPPE